MEVLKPCPFCGAVPVIRTTHTPNSDFTMYVLEVEHLRCCYFTSLDGDNTTGRETAYNSQILTKTWNRRFPRR